MGSFGGGKGWVAFVVIDSLVTFFGLSYIFFPMGSVVEDGNKTTGVLEVPREAWGSYVVLSAVVLLVVALTGYRRGRPWAFRAMAYQFVFLVVVAAVEPDPVVPTIFAVVLAATMWWGRQHFAERSGQDVLTA